MSYEESATMVDMEEVIIIPDFKKGVEYQLMPESGDARVVVLSQDVMEVEISQGTNKGANYVRKIT